MGKGDYSSSSGRLTSVVILNTVIEIGDGAFNNNKLPDNQAFIYARTDSNYDGVAEIDNTTIVSYGGANKNPVIQNNVIIIGPNAFTNNQLTSVIIKTKTSSSEFSKYGNYPWSWASDVTCVKNNTSNVTNGCITWELVNNKVLHF